MKTAELTVNAVIAQCDEAQRSLDEGRLVQANGTLRTAIDILTKYILKIRLNVQDDLDLFSRIEYLRGNGIITAAENSLLEAVRKAGNNALHSGTNNDEAFDIQARIKGVRDLAARAPLLTAKDAKGDPIGFDQDLSDNVLGDSDIGLTYRSLAKALRQNQAFGVSNYSESLIGLTLGLFYGREFQNKDLKDRTQILLYIASVRESLLSAEDRDAMEMCWNCISNNIYDDQLFAAATELMRHYPHLIRKALKCHKHQTSLLHIIFGGCCMVIQWILGLLMIIAVPCAILFAIICVIDIREAISEWYLTLVVVAGFCAIFFGIPPILYYVPWPMDMTFALHPYWCKSCYDESFLGTFFTTGQYFKR